MEGVSGCECECAVEEGRQSAERVQAKKEEKAGLVAQFGQLASDGIALAWLVAEAEHRSKNVCLVESERVDWCSNRTRTAPSVPVKSALHWLSELLLEIREKLVTRPQSSASERNTQSVVSRKLCCSSSRDEQADIGGNEDSFFVFCFALPAVAFFLLSLPPSPSLVVLLLQRNLI